MSDLRAAAARLSTLHHPARRWLATALALLAVAGLTALDASWSETISATVVVAPFIAALFAGVGQTAVVACAAVASALLSGIWNDNFGDAGYVAALRDRGHRRDLLGRSSRARARRRRAPRRSASS